jgi:hypothetical protein
MQILLHDWILAPVGAGKITSDYELNSAKGTAIVPYLASEFLKLIKEFPIDH